MARWQLLGMGVGAGAIDHLIGTGYLHPLHPGVYAVGHAHVELHGRWQGAVLACGPRAVLSHRDAAYLWGFQESNRRAIDVTAPGRSRHVSRELTVHRVRSLAREHLTSKDRVPVTTVARTLLDLAEVVNARRLRRAYEETQRAGLFDLRAVQAVMSTSPGRHGLRPLGSLVAEQLDAPATKRDLEARFYDVIREHDVPMPLFNAALLGYEVDALWPDALLVVELDSFEFHGKSRAQHERDRVKQVDLQLAGYTVLRYTWSMLSEPAAAAAQLRAFLGLATSRP